MRRLIEQLLPLSLLGWQSVHVDQKLLKDQKTDLADVAHRVQERPHDRVDHHLEHLSRQCLQSSEAVLVYSLQHLEEVDAVLGELLKVL